jgi:hypothetical protein
MKPTDTNRMEISWERELSSLLTELSSVQAELLALLGEKRQALVDKDNELLARCEPRERELIDRLQRCHDMRGQLLQRAGEAKLPCSSIRALTGSLAAEQREALAQQVDEAAVKARLLQHQSLTNWVFVQRSLIHLSQLLEIIATGGRMQPTYGKEQSGPTRSSIVDQAA